MSEELIKSQGGRITQLDNDNANLRAALKEARNKLKAAVADRDAAFAERNEFANTVTELSAERDDLAARADQAPTESLARVKELEAAIASRDHKDAFSASAMKAGVKADRVADLYSLSGLKPGDGPAKPEDFADYLATAKEARPWAFDGDTPADGGSSVAARADKAAVGSQAAVNLGRTAQANGGGRGAHDTSVARVQYSLSEVAKPGWQQARPELRDAIAKGEAVCVGD